MAEDRKAAPRWRLKKFGTAGKCGLPQQDIHVMFWSWPDACPAPTAFLNSDTSDTETAPFFQPIGSRNLETSVSLLSLFHPRAPVVTSLVPVG
jgi:hypothetical protein